MLGQTGITALQLGSHRLEVDKPVLEDSPCQFLEGLIQLPVQFDLVVQRAEDVGDGSLCGRGKEPLRVFGKEWFDLARADQNLLSIC